LLAGRFAILNSMKIELPPIPDAERTPLVEALLGIIDAQQQRIQQLEETVGKLRDEIALLQGEKPRPKIAPSRLETPPPKPPPAPGDQRPGSAKRSKKASFVTPIEVTIPFPDPPPGSTSKGYEEYFVQELLIQAKVTRYLRERILTPEGQTLLAPLPDDVLPGGHFGPILQGYILYQYHHCNVTQPLLLEQLLDLGIDISAGQINRILTENKDDFHQEKAEVLSAGLETASYLGVDDTGARHNGKNGFCTAIGNDLFAYFESTDSKSRLNFLTVLRGTSTRYTINEVTITYWQRQKLPLKVIELLNSGPQQFADEAAWQARLGALGITVERHVLIATEGALLGQIIEQGASPELVILSDGAPQFDLLVHASCWVHAERPLARMVPYHEAHRAEIERLRDQIWELYKDLKTYRAKPDSAAKADLEARFDTLVNQKTNYPSSIGAVLKEMREHKDDLLRVLERPEVPLHNNDSESIIRGYVKTRKISGSTRSEAGRRCRDTFASLKKTCRKLGVSFWAYLCDRVHGLGQISRLAEVIRQKAEEIASGKAQAASSEAVGGGAAR
jgi:Transposase IS66 family